MTWSFVMEHWCLYLLSFGMKLCFRPYATLALHTVWNEAYIMLVSCIDYALDMTCIQSVSQCFIVGGIL